MVGFQPLLSAPSVASEFTARKQIATCMVHLAGLALSLFATQTLRLGERENSFPPAGTQELSRTCFQTWLKPVLGTDDAQTSALCVYLARMARSYSFNKERE